jgi:sensor histidine kinase YesM
MEDNLESPRNGRKGSRLMGVAVWAGLSTTLFLLTFLYRYLDDLARAKKGTFAERLIEQSTGVYTAMLLFIIVTKLVRRFRLNAENWPRRILVYLLAAIIFSALHTTILAVSREAIFQMAGMGSYDYGIMPIRYPMEFANYALWFGVWVTLIHLLDHYQSSRERELRTAQLETQLAQAQLQALQAQIHPHFLFNALNTISSVIYEDVQAADTMIARLSDFLRHSLSASNSQEVTLREELNFLNLYLDVMRPRFEERLQVAFEVEQGLDNALTPRLILQPLVENSVKHAADPESGDIRIAVRARRENGRLSLQIEDSGPGLAPTARALHANGAGGAGNGIGLTNTAERLKRLYGQEQEFTIRSADRGGLLVSLKLPYRIANATNGTRG